MMSSFEDEARKILHDCFSGIGTGPARLDYDGAEKLISRLHESRVARLRIALHDIKATTNVIAKKALEEK